MSDAAEREDPATQARGREEKDLNEQAAEHGAEEKRAEQEAEAIEQPDAPAEPADPDQLRGEIAEAREELGETVEALVAKVDVKARAKEKVEEQKAQAQEKVEEATEQVKERPVPVAAIAGGVVALVVLVIVLKKRGN